MDRGATVQRPCLHTSADKAKQEKNQRRKEGGRRRKGIPKVGYKGGGRTTKSRTTCAQAAAWLAGKQSSSSSSSSSPPCGGGVRSRPASIESARCCSGYVGKLRPVHVPSVGAKRKESSGGGVKKDKNAVLHERQVPHPSDGIPQGFPSGKKRSWKEGKGGNEWQMNPKAHLLQSLS